LTLPAAKLAGQLLRKLVAIVKICLWQKSSLGIHTFESLLHVYGLLCTALEIWHCALRLTVCHGAFRRNLRTVSANPIMICLISSDIPLSCFPRHRFYCQLLPAKLSARLLPSTMKKSIIQKGSSLDLSGLLVSGTHPASYPASQSSWSC
jgi:hypothetical protein